MHNLKVEILPPKKWYKRAQLKLLEEYHPPSKSLVIPKSFITDGTSTPLPFRTFVPQLGPTLPASVVHDYLLSQGLKWKDAACGYRRELVYLKDISKIKARILYFFVRLWGLLKR